VAESSATNAKKASLDQNIVGVRDKDIQNDQDGAVAVYGWTAGGRATSAERCPGVKFITTSPTRHVAPAFAIARFAKRGLTSKPISGVSPQSAFLAQAANSVPAVQGRCRGICGELAAS
jgi:hypothetical protein